MTFTGGNVSGKSPFEFVSVVIKYDKNIKGLRKKAGSSIFNKNNNICICTFVSGKRKLHESE